MRLDALYCCDNKYAPYLGVSMTSLLENNRDAEEITVYIIYDNVSPENLERFCRQASRYGSSRKVVLIDGAPHICHLQQMNMVSYRGGHAYALRLFFLRHMAQATERLLYLDCDTLICGNLQSLFATPMGDAPAAVVLDSLSGYYKCTIGLSEKDTYFNSGVILFNVAQWRHCRCEESLQTMLADPNFHYPNPDQDVLNLLLLDKKILLSPKYNFQVTHQVYTDRTYFATYPTAAYYTAAELAEARRDPVILHAYRFLGQFPWHRKSLHPWKTLFWQYAAQSEWADLEPLTNKGILFAVERILFRLLPKRCFLPLLRTVQAYTFHKIQRRIRKREAEK